MEGISREYRVAILWELLYADDLVVIDETTTTLNSFNGMKAETEDDLIKSLIRRS